MTVLDMLSFYMHMFTTFTSMYIVSACIYIVLEFKQRQPEVERSQVITSLRIGEGAHATVSICMHVQEWHMLYVHVQI